MYTLVLISCLLGGENVTNYMHPNPNVGEVYSLNTCKVEIAEGLTWDTYGACVDGQTAAAQNLSPLEDKIYMSCIRTRDALNF